MSAKVPAYIYHWFFLFENSLPFFFVPFLDSLHFRLIFLFDLCSCFIDMILIGLHLWDLWVSSETLWNEIFLCGGRFVCIRFKTRSVPLTIPLSLNFARSGGKMRIFTVQVFFFYILFWIHFAFPNCNWLAIIVGLFMLNSFKAFLVILRQVSPHGITFRRLNDTVRSSGMLWIIFVNFWAEW